MEHIGYKVFYKAAFDLQASKNSRGDILWDMIEEIRYWITVKYRKKETPSQKKHRCGLIGKEEKPSDLKAVRLFCILAFV